jgi:hypothetical protein
MDIGLLYSPICGQHPSVIQAWRDAYKPSQQGVIFDVARPWRQCIFGYRIAWSITSGKLMIYVRCFPLLYYIRTGTLLYQCILCRVFIILCFCFSAMISGLTTGRWNCSKWSDLLFVSILWRFHWIGIVPRLFCSVFPSDSCGCHSNRPCNFPFRKCG